MSVLLSGALIVRDESRVLGECLASIRDVVDEIVVVDTGSIDDTADIARDYGARVIHHAWRNDGQSTSRIIAAAYHVIIR